jgi:CRP-like cAMP-binding protein
VELELRIPLASAARVADDVVVLPSFKVPGLESSPLPPPVRAEKLEATRWAPDLSFQENQTFANYLETYRAAKGTAVIREGATDAYMCLILEGRVSIVKTGPAGEPVEIATLGRDKSVGEMSLIDGEPRSASAIAVQDVVLFVLSKENFARMSDDVPRLALKLIVKIAKSLSQRLRMTSGQLVDALRP